MTPIVPPIPDRVVAYVGGLNYLLRAYVLWKDRQMIVIQAPTVDLILERFRKFGKYRFSFTNSELRELELEYWRGLELIHPLVDTIDFGKTNWGYLVQKPTGGYQITQKNKAFHKITMPLWAPLVDEDDIIYTTWWECEHRSGMWKGREVEVLMGWDGDDEQMKTLELSMQGYQYVRGMDLTYEVLGHVMRDGSVIGLMTEPHIGRIMQSCDRALLYDAVSRMERRRLVHMGPTTPNLIIQNGKVRLINLACIRHFNDDQEEDFKATAAIRHWENLEKVFSQMDPSTFYYIPNYLRDRQQKLHLLPAVPSVERPIRIEMFLQHQARPYLFDVRKIKKEHEKKMERLRRLRLSAGTRVPESLETEPTDLISEAVEERPYVATTNRSRPKKRSNQHYSIENSASRKLLLAYEDA